MAIKIGDVVQINYVLNHYSTSRIENPIGIVDLIFNGGKVLVEITYRVRLFDGEKHIYRIFHESQLTVIKD